ncbi:MAG TPA: c-type cytochrome domain-containing protein [Gammaproteobacteria bacterium]|nr:c-type cytochrome domain-containing protein [Gammaproteobacteria bacterium]
MAIHPRSRFPAIALLSLAALLAASCSSTPQQRQVSFQHDVQPILQKNCVSCHQPGGIGYERSGVDLRSYQGVMKGTKYGAVVEPRHAYTSNLMVLVEGRADPSIRMPYHKQALVQADIDTLREWINQGAKDN